MLSRNSVREKDERYLSGLSFSHIIYNSGMHRHFLAKINMLHYKVYFQPTCLDWSDFTAEINSDVLSLHVVMSVAAVSKLISLENSTRVRSFSSPLDLVRRRLAIMGALHQRCYYSSSLTNRISILQYFIKTMV